MIDDQYDFLLVGGGLQNGLIALALADRRPGARVAMVERSSTLAGNHTWCFHAAHMPEGTRRFVDPLIAHRWPGYLVRFPGRERRLTTEYACIPSVVLANRLHELADRGGLDLHLESEVTAVSEHEVCLADGRRLHGRLVVDARGPDALTCSRTGYQKFLGLELLLEAPHGLELPVLMDATVPQRDGFSFLYTLPLGPRRLLIEATCFSRSPELEPDELREWVLSSALESGYRVEKTIRQESGVLPMPWEHEASEPRRGPLVAGYAGGWFHPATGYSFPVALRLAMTVADAEPDELFAGRLRSLFHEHRTQLAYAVFLNGLLFRFFEPGRMWNVFDRFYKLPEPLIDRFYALRTTASDRARMLLGRPPRGMSLRGTVEALRSVGR